MITVYLNDKWIWKENRIHITNGGTHTVVPEKYIN